MTEPDIEDIEERNDIRRERYSADRQAIQDIDDLLKEIGRLRHELQIKVESEVDLRHELDPGWPPIS